MVSHNNVDMVGKAQFITDDIKQQFVRQTATLRIFRASVYYLLENDMPVRIVGQIGKSNYFLKISPMSVEITCYNQAAIRRQMNQITAPKLICNVGSYAPIQQINYCSKHFCSFLFCPQIYCVPSGPVLI